MGRFLLTRAAINDLREIWNYTFETWSEEQADKYYSLLIQEFKYISKNPDLGKSYNEVEPKLLAAIFKMHLIFYRKIGTNKIEITRILHQNMDISSRFK